jgi:hypothetical protein
MMQEIDLPSLVSILDRSPKEHEPPLDVVNFALAQSKALLSFSKNNTALLFGAVDSPSSALPQKIRHMLCLSLFGKCVMLNEHYLQHIIAAHLTLYWLASLNEKQSPSESTDIHKKLITFFASKQLKVWPYVFALKRIITRAHSARHLGDERLNKLQRLCLTVSALVYRNQNESLFSTLSAIAQHYPARDHELLSSLCNLITAAMPGEVVYVKAKRAIIVDIQTSHSLIFVSGDKETSPYSWVANSTLMRTGQPRIAFEELSKHITDAFDYRRVEGGQSMLPVSFSIQYPPRPLLTIIDALRKPNAELDDITAKVEESPLFSSFLLKTASKDNRLQLPVKSIKQAILTYGIERIGDMLIQHALMERLTQHSYPLLAISKQYTLLACAISAELACRVKTKFTAQSASLITAFLCAPLFTFPGLKVASRLVANTKPDFSVTALFRLKGSNEWNAIAGELATNWHQSATWRALIHHSHKPTHDVPASLKKEHAILQLAMGISREILFNERLPTAISQTEKALLTHINVTPAQFNTLLTGLSDYLFCPIAQ